MGRAIVTKRHQDGFEGHLGVQRGGALEGHEGNGMILGDGADQGFHRIIVALVPKGREGAALQFAAIAGAEVRAGEAERKALALVEFEDERIGKGIADTRRVNVLPVGRAARTTNGIPVFVERPGARLLHFFPTCQTLIKRPIGNVDAADRHWQMPRAKALLKNT
ncbi:hypothetical protein D9M68_770220 [compost metagenome]